MAYKLTDIEKTAISDSWKLISGDLKGHGVNMLLQYLRDFKDSRVYFQAYDGMDEATLRRNHQFRTHSSLIMFYLSSIVENLDDPGCFTDLMKRHVKTHAKRNIGQKQYQDMFATIVKTLDAGLKGTSTPLAIASWKKAFEVIGETIAQESA